MGNSPDQPAKVYVCHAGSCTRNGSEAALVEIEELLGGNKSVSVQPSGCLGLCSQGPAAVVQKGSSRASERAFTRLTSLEATAGLAAFASGTAADDLVQSQTAETRLRLEEVRGGRMRRYAASVFKWNGALKGLKEQVMRRQAEGGPFAELSMERAMILAKAGYWEKALEVLERETAGEEEADIEAVLKKTVEILAMHGKIEKLEKMEDDIVEWIGGSSSLGSDQREPNSKKKLKAVLQYLGSCRSRLLADEKKKKKNFLPAEPLDDPVGSSKLFPSHIENYTRWTLTHVTVVSAHSAVFHLKSADLKRATPHPRGKGKHPKPVTWHTTLLAPLLKEEENLEETLPWIERDYTPISSAKDWEIGSCDLLIKVYNDGQATSWLHTLSKEAQPQSVLLSQPLTTLEMPQLSPPTGPQARTPTATGGLLLILAGTGVVALPQILAHRDPTNKLNIATRRLDQLRLPIDLRLSCRADDLLMLPEIIQWCKEGLLDEATISKTPFSGLRSCVLHVTSSSEEQQEKSSSDIVEKPFYFDATQTERLLTELEELENATVLQRRIDMAAVEEAVGALNTKSRRVVVSGPSGFNATVRGMLIDCKVEDENITILAA